MFSYSALLKTGYLCMSQDATYLTRPGLLTRKFQELMGFQLLHHLYQMHIPSSICRGAPQPSEAVNAGVLEKHVLIVCPTGFTKHNNGPKVDIECLHAYLTYCA